MISKIASGVVLSAFPCYLGASFGYRYLRKSEPFQVVKEHETFEERTYQMILKAEVSLMASSYFEAFRRGLEQLDGYIQGGNSRMRRVPVVYPISTYIYHGEDRKEGALILINDRLHPKENAAIYRIYWPFDDRITRSLIGKPNNPYIQLKQINDQRVVAKKFPGYMTENNISKNIQLLKTDAESQGYQLDEIRVAVYDPIWVFYPFRRNEIIATIR